MNVVFLANTVKNIEKKKNIAQVDFIVACLRKGQQRKAILANFAKKWQNISERTFDRRLNDAVAKFQAEQSYIQAQAEQEVAKEVEARKEAIMSTIERKEILTKIARGKVPMLKPMVVSQGAGMGSTIETIEVAPSWEDRRAAIAELNKMDGAYASEKSEIKVMADPCIIDWSKSAEDTPKTDDELFTNP